MLVQCGALCRWGLSQISAVGTGALSSGLPGELRDFTLMLGGASRRAQASKTVEDSRSGSCASTSSPCRWPLF